MRAMEDFNDHLNALAILSRAKVAALDAIHERNETFARHCYIDGAPAPALSLFTVLEAWRTAANAYDHIQAWAFRDLQ